jgi:hypothetical protein
VQAGCQKLAFATSEAGTPSLMAREHGFVAAAKEMGLDVTVARIWPYRLRGGCYTRAAASDTDRSSRWSVLRVQDAALPQIFMIGVGLNPGEAHLVPLRRASPSRSTPRLRTF